MSETKSNKSTRPKDLKDVVNFYEILPPKFKSEERTYDSFNEIQIKIPFRMVLTGGTGSGKTNALMRLFNIMNCFDRVLLYAGDLSEDLYAYFTDSLEQAEKATGYRILTKSNDISTLTDVGSHDKKLNTLLIIDDMVTEKHKHLMHAAKYWTMGRKKNISSIFISQSYYDVPSMIRKNTEYFIFTKIRTARDLTFILKEFQLGLTQEQIMELFVEATREGFPNFFMIDTNNVKDTSYRFRKNFSPMTHQIIQQTQSPGEVKPRLIPEADEENGDKKRKRVKFKDSDNNHSSESDDEPIPKDETDKQRVKRFGKKPSKKRVMNEGEANLIIENKRIEKLLPNPNKPITVNDQLKQLGQLLGHSVAKLKSMAKKLGLTNKQLCDQLEMAIINGEFDDQLTEQQMTDKK